MTDSNPIARFRKNRQEAGKKFREKLKKNEEIIKQTTSSKVIRGALSGPLKAVNETVEFVDDIYDYAVGNPYDNNELIDLQALGLEIKGDKEDWAYTVPQAITQFLLPAGVISKGLKGTKLVGMGNAWARNAVAGFVTDAVVQDPYEENLFNMIDKHPRLATPISELLKAKTPEEISVAEARFRQATGGLLAGEALTALGLGVKAMKKTPELYERVIKRLSRRDEILMTDNVVDNLGDEIIDLSIDKQPTKVTPKNTTPVKLDLPDTRGQGKFYHGTSQEIALEEGGEAASSQNIYGNGFYTTEDLITASKYQKKGKKQILRPEIPIAKGIKKERDLPFGIQKDLKKLNITDEELNQLTTSGIKVPSSDRLKDLANQARQFPIDNPFSDGGRTIAENFNKIADRLDELADNPPTSPDFRPVTYEITEKQPVNFYDLDQSVDADLKTFINNFDDSPFENIVSEAINDLGDNYTLSQLFDEIRAYSNARGVSSNTVIDDIFGNFQDYFKEKGFGGFTHQGGKKAGKGKRLHQVKIYFDPANQIDINKVDLDALADPKVQTTFNPKFTGGGDPDVQELILKRADELKKLDANNAWPYKRTFADMVKNANDLLPAEVIESARLFNARYGRGGEEDLPATLIAMNQLMNKNAINLASLAKSMDESLAAGNKAGFQELKGQFVTEAKVLDGLITLNKPLKTVPAQTLAANRAGGGVGKVAASVEDLTGRTPTEKAIDQATDIRGTVKEPTDPLAEFSLEEILNAAEQGDKASLKKLRLITKKLQAAQGNPQALQKMASESKIMRGLKVQNEIFINSILSGPETHAVNILSTGLNTLARPLEQTLGSFAQGDMTGAIRGGKELYYLISSITDSLKGAKLSFQIEDNIVNPGAMIQDADRFQVRMEGDGNLANIVNAFGTIIRLPSRFLLAEDEFFKQLNFRAYVKASAWEDGMRKGLQGADLQDHIQRQFDGTIEIVNKNSMANVKDKSVLDLYEKAQQYAAETTFTADLPEGSLGGAIQGVARHPAGRIVFPFVRTPINIFKAQVRRTPGVNMLLQEYRQALKSTDPSVVAKAKGEMILGGSIWAIAGLTAYSINDPMSELAITGGGPSDFNMLNQKRATGWQPYSFRFLLKDENGNVRMGKDGKPRYKYVSFKRLDPWSSFLMMAADAAAITGGLSKQDRDDFGVAASVALGRNITNKTYLQGITELADLLGKPYKLESWLARRAAATINPLSSFGRSVKRSGLTTSYGQLPGDRRILDKKVRAGDDGFVVLRKFHNELAATIPGYTGGLRPMRNFITGSVIEYPVGFGPDTMNILNPIKETNSINNNVLTTLDDIGARITQPSDELGLARLPSGKTIGGGIELTYDEHLDLIEETAFVKINGITMVRALHNRIQQKDFQALMKSVRGELIEQNNMDIEVKAQEANRDLAEDILRDIVNKYKRAGKKVWLSKNPERELEYKQLQAAYRKEANNDILEGFNQLN
jgi:hypothetical protein